MEEPGDAVEQVRRIWGESMVRHRPAFTMERPRTYDVPLLVARAAIMGASDASPALNAEDIAAEHHSNPQANNPKIDREE